MRNVSEESVLSMANRYNTKLYLEHKGFDVDDRYEFELVKDGERCRARITHFGFIKIEGGNAPENLIDFTDDLFQQKRQTVVNNIAKCFGITKGASHGKA